MPEMSTAENEELVSRVYTQALRDRQDGRPLDAADLMVWNRLPCPKSLRSFAAPSTLHFPMGCLRPTTRRASSPSGPGSRRNV